MITHLHQSVICECVNFTGVTLSGFIFFNFTATNITIDTEGLLTAEAGGYAPGKGPGQGIGHDTGSSGGSHGGTGGRGSSTTYAGLAYDSIRRPRQLGSGGGTTRSVTNGYGGGAIFLKASKYVEIDGELQANGGTGSDTAAGGGAGGSIVIETQDFLGKQRPLVKSVFPKVNFLISQAKHMLWVLKRTISMRWFI